MLKLDETEISPAFDPEIKVYTATVPYKIDKVTVTAVAEYENAVVVTQYGAEQLKCMGVEVLYMLSSNTLDIIAKCASRVALDIENIPLDDVKTLELFRQGSVEGVFRAAANEEQPLTFDRLVSLYSRHCSNRAHAICATILAYRAAYLRAHYPAIYAETCNKR